MGEASREISVRNVDSGGDRETRDRVVVEEPLEIRIGKTSVSVTLRTPGHDEELAAGFLFTENVISSASDLVEVSHCREIAIDESKGNVIVATLGASARVDLERLRRNFYATSSCGICGKASLDQVRQMAEPIREPISIPAALLRDLPNRMRSEQTVFEETGGLHAAGLFDASGRLLCMREDVGRHNAVDKVIGWAVLEDRLPLERTILQVSGRANFEITQKALMAGIGVVSAVSAASTLAIELARANNMTLVGFVRADRFVIYAGDGQIVADG